MSSTHQVFDLNDLEDDFLESTSNFDLESLTGNQLDFSPNDTQSLSTLDAKENAPTLESILNEDDDFDSEEFVKSLKQSLGNTQTNRGKAPEAAHQPKYSGLVEKNGCVCKLASLKQISTQLVNAIDRSDSGLPTALAVDQLIAVGTSRGLILLFDSLQVLKLYITTDFKDAVSALSFNNKCDRLLVGNATGLIFMFDATNGKCLRTIADAHPSGNAILNLKFTDDSKLACFSDSGGSVFMLEFKRVMGVRGANSTCLFSGSRGEVCQIEPLKFEKFSETLVDKLAYNNSSTVKKNLNNIQNLFNKFTLLAMASFTKIFVVTLKPKLTVLFTYPLSGNMKYLPIVNWQLVIVQRMSSVIKNNRKVMQPKRFVSPILACARESTIHFFQVDYYQNEGESDSQHKSNDSFSSVDFKFIQLQKSEFKYKILNFCWLNAKTLAILDESEKIHITDIRSNEELQVLNDLSSIQLIYSSTFFKSLATGGYVSKALAYAGENACYNTIQSYLGQFFMLGSRSIVLFSLQNWSTRIDDFVNDNNLDLALDIALSMFKGESKALIGLPIDTKLRKEKIVDKIIDVLYLYVNRAIKQDLPDDTASGQIEKHYKSCSKKFVDVCIDIERHDILFDSLYNLICCDALFEGFFLESLEEHVLNNRLPSIPPVILKNFIEYYVKNPQLSLNLERCILNFKIESLDLHNLIQLCKKNRLLDAFIHLYNNVLGDYLTPVEEILQMMDQCLMFLTHETASIALSQTEGNQESIDFFNKLLVYIHVCLCGQTYPYGIAISDEVQSDHVRRTMFDYLVESKNALIDKLLAEESKDPSSALAKHFDDSLNSSLGSHPILRMLLNFNMLDFLNVITMSFNEPSFEAVIGLEKKQQLIDILIEISLNSSGFNYHLAGNLFTFLARQIANESNNIKVEDIIFSQIIEYLCNTDDVDRIEEREQTLLCLLNSKNANILERFSVERLLHLSLKAKFYRTCEILYETRGEFCEIIDCYLNPENSHERQNKIFNVVRSILQNTVHSDKAADGNHAPVRRSDSFIEPKDSHFKDLQNKLIRYETLKQMININPCECIFLLWIEMNIDLKFLIDTIKNFSTVDREQYVQNSDSDYFEACQDLNEMQLETRGKQPMSQELLFKFMKGLFDLAELIKPDRKYIYYMSQLNAEYCELYVDLVCVYKPDQILNVLQSTLSDYSYRVDECLRICRKRKVWDGAAYLLEKSGQIEAAFSLKSEKLSSLIRDKQAKLMTLSETELAAAKESIGTNLGMIVQLCQRNSQSLNDIIKEKIWFTLFDEVMKPIQAIQFMKSDVEGQIDSNNQTRLEETKLFFKDLGSYIINSMMGYLNLTTIIDRIICDPMYGASNFGDIKHLMIKMVEMCTYEQILLAKTCNLVSDDVYSKLFTFKKYSCKSFSSLTSYCNYCSKPLEPSFKEPSIKSNASIIESLPLDTSRNDQNSFDVKTDPGDIPINIFHCGHSFHETCLEMYENYNGACPLCNLGALSIKKNKTAPRNTSSPIKASSSVKKASPSHAEQKPNPNYFNRNITFTSKQIAALSSIRHRTNRMFSVNGQAFSSNSMPLNIEKQSKLKLAPGNLSKFI